MSDPYPSLGAERMHRGSDEMTNGFGCKASASEGEASGGSCFAGGKVQGCRGTGLPKGLQIAISVFHRGRKMPIVSKETYELWYTFRELVCTRMSYLRGANARMCSAAISRFGGGRV
jgi:hypothetical protein